MNEWHPPSPFAWSSPPALLAPSTISSTAQAALLHSHPSRTPGFAGLCYDCNQCVLHTSLFAPILRWDAHIKECHFQRSGVSHAHKCCLDTWSGKIKTACLPVRVLCGGYDCRGRCLRCPFHFLLPSRFFFHCCREVLIHGFCENLCGCGGLLLGSASEYERVEIRHCRCKQTFLPLALFRIWGQASRNRPCVYSICLDWITCSGGIHSGVAAMTEEDFCCNVLLKH